MMKEASGENGAQGADDSEKRRAFVPLVPYGTEQRAEENKESLAHSYLVRALRELRKTNGATRMARTIARDYAADCPGVFDDLPKQKREEILGKDD